MKTKIKWIVPLLCLVLALTALSFGVVNSVYAAEEKEENILAPSTTIHISEFDGYAGDGATVNADRSASVNPYGRFGAVSPVANATVHATITVSTPGHIGFILRAQGDAPLPIQHNGWLNGGYGFVYYNHGQCELFKNNTTVTNPFWPPFPSLSIGVPYAFEFSAIDILDGEGIIVGVRIQVTINGVVVMSHDDMTDPILDAGWVALTSHDAAAFTVDTTWNQRKEPVLRPRDISAPLGSGNFPLENINDTGTVLTTSATGVSGVSGAAFASVMKGGYAIEAQVKPSAAEGKLTFVVGATKINSHEMNRPNTMDGGPSGWGWDESGYILDWSANGQRHLWRNGVLLNYAWALPAMEANTVYQVVFGYRTLSDDVNLIYFKINGALAASWLDATRDNYTPLRPNAHIVPYNSLVYSLICSGSLKAEIILDDKTQAEQKEFTTKDLGTPTISDLSSTTINDRNGGLTFGSGFIAGYNGFQSDAVITKMNLNTVSSAIVFSLRSKGTYDSPSGGGWSNKGYSICLYPNGQVAILKNGVVVLEGWATGGFGFGANIDYIIETGAVNLPNGGVRVYAIVNGTEVINYTDLNNTIDAGGWFHLFSNSGSAGKLSAGPSVVLPLLTTEDNVTEIKQGQSVQLRLTGGPYMTATYTVDDSSTGSGTITNGIFKATRAGLVKIYALADGLYSQEITIDVLGRRVVITPIPDDKLVLGGNAYIIEASMLPQEPIESVSYELVSGGTGNAILHSATGELTPTAVGTIFVQATINGEKSEIYTLRVVNPTVVLTGIDAGTKMIANETVLTLDYTADITPNNPQIIYFARTNASFVSIDGNQLTGIKAGRVGLIVSLNDYESAEVFVDIVPIVTIGNIATLVVGERKVLNYELNCETDAVAHVEYLLVGGEEYVTLASNSGIVTAKAVGSVALKVIVNGTESRIYAFRIEEPTVTVAGIEDMVVGQQRKIDGRINGGLQVETKVFSIVNGAQHIELDQDGTLKAVSSGKASVRVTINGYASVDVELFVTDLQIEILIPSQIEYLDSFKLSFATNNEDLIITKAVYSILSGQKSAEIKNDTIIAKSDGAVELKLIINDSYESIKTITVYGTPKILFNGQKNLQSNSEINLSYTFDDTSVFEDNVSYTILTGGEIARIENGKLIFFGYGRVTVQVIVNNEFSADAVFETVDDPTIVDPSDPTDPPDPTEPEEQPTPVGLIVGLSVGSVGTVTGSSVLAYFIVKRRRIKLNIIKGGDK